MESNTSQSTRAGELGELELTILLFIWRKGTMTAEQVREELGPPFDGQAVRIALRRLEDAGRLTHSVENHMLLYRPAEPAGRAAEPLRICL
jgi:predicted transcriptional regulator